MAVMVRKRIIRKQGCTVSKHSVLDKRVILSRQIITRRRAHIVNAVGLAALVLVALAIAYYITQSSTPNKQTEPPDPISPLPASPSKLQKFAKAAVCSDGEPCSAIGRDVLAENGTAVDAALATLFCNGLVNSQSMGLGGGFMMVLYESHVKTGRAVIARESAPAAISDELFTDKPGATRSGPLSIAVPGELKGYWSVHQQYGRLTWARIIQPTIDLCEEGYIMSKHQRDSLDYRNELIRKDPYLHSVFVNASSDAFYPQGTLIRPHAFCSTLRVIADEGGDTLYNGSLANLLIEDLKEAGGVITLEDLADYKVRWSEPLKTELNGDLTLLGVPPPGSGVLLAMILKILDGFRFTPSDLLNTEGMINKTSYIVETFKYAFAKRGELGDPFFTNLQDLISNLTSEETARNIKDQILTAKSITNDPEHYGGRVFSYDDHGTAHVSVIDADGNAVSVTSSVNLYFGAGFASKQTGIILNSGIDDFSFPQFQNFFGLGWSPANRLAPGKMSLSSMCPTIVLGGDQVRLVIGASGGTKITTAVALVFMWNLWFGENIKAAVDASRFHHQLMPPTISYEYGMTQAIHDGLEQMGHNLTRYRDRGSIVCALEKLGEFIYGNADYRKGGEVYGL